MHLNTKQNPGGYHSNEHYCRRWISIGVIEELKKKNISAHNSEQYIVGIQKSKFINSNDEYLSISIAKHGRIKKEIYSSVTLGFLAEPNITSKIKFFNDPKIKVKEVNDTCENCNLFSCKERVAEPTMVNSLIKSHNIQLAIDKLVSDVD